MRISRHLCWKNRQRGEEEVPGFCPLSRSCNRNSDMTSKSQPLPAAEGLPAVPKWGSNANIVEGAAKWGERRPRIRRCFLTVGPVCEPRAAQAPVRKK